MLSTNMCLVKEKNKSGCSNWLISIDDYASEVSISRGWQWRYNDLSPSQKYVIFMLLGNMQTLRTDVLKTVVIETEECNMINYVIIMPE